MTTTIYYTRPGQGQAEAKGFELPEEQDYLEGFVTILVLHGCHVERRNIPDHADDERRAAQGQ
ncbi:MAG: hypothetical protein EPO08_21020 [Rhodospirillaceae bacterium]|nr:MAG: hypothetical protein EPO08_21020 [Rhodospirillaceae bacterium]